MTFKKINAGLALITAFLGLFHIVYVVITYLLMWYNPTIIGVTAGIFMTLTLIHAVLGMISITVLVDGTDLKSYPKQNITTIVQRVSGILIFPLVFLHVNTFDLLTDNAASGNMIMFWLLIVIQVFFFGDVLTHIALSVTRALITLGLLTSSSKRERIDRLVYVGCGCLFVAAVFAVTKFDLMLIGMAGVA